MDEQRKIDIRLAKALGYTVRGATMFSPSGTLMGGNHIGMHLGYEEVTDQAISECWEQMTPHFSTSIEYAFSILDALFNRYGLGYNLFLDTNSKPTCEIGWWSTEPDEPDHDWTANADTPALAIVGAAIKCEIFIGVE